MGAALAGGCFLGAARIEGDLPTVTLRWITFLSRITVSGTSRPMSVRPTRLIRCVSLSTVTVPYCSTTSPGSSLATAAGEPGVADFGQLAGRLG